MDFSGRKLIIATKHHKEKVIGPLVEKHLGSKWFVDDNFDTDLLGTFCGEIERENDALTTLRNKCLDAMEKNDCDLGIASEGSFGPHPSLFFAPAADELMVFVDTKNKLEIYSRELSTETNFGGLVIKNLKEADEFATRHGFPKHALIVKNHQVDFDYVRKGVNNHEDLKQFVNDCMEKYGSAFLETDMRAMFNPSRMKVIQKAAEKLMEKVNSKCPECQTPGFGITASFKGLPCALCSFPTESTLYHQSECSKCGFSAENYFPNGKKTEDPMYCSYCNP
jgi:hypothetical protein